jgi:hypothetical protein
MDVKLGLYEEHRLRVFEVRVLRGNEKCIQDVRMDLREREWVVVDWMHQAQNRD